MTASGSSAASRWTSTSSSWTVRRRKATGYNGAKMTAWGPVLGPEKVAQVTAYVVSELDEYK
jgi:mono/diheme cytochrome c family protein